MELASLAPCSTPTESHTQALRGCGSIARVAEESLVSTARACVTLCWKNSEVLLVKVTMNCRSRAVGREARIVAEHQPRLTRSGRDRQLRSRCHRIIVAEC